jgi:hypothetical protein
MHLFIVSETTLPVHLSYGFAGVMKRKDCDWSQVTINPQSERTQAAMYADICRVHRGDEILFYLETPVHDVGREGGRFLGVFEVESEAPFYEPSGQYLHEQLGMPLIYRLIIRPKEVYSEGITEWQAMDEMTDYRSIHDIPWTLIYRKMLGGRGCTPLLPHEAGNLRRMLDLRNAGQRISPRSVGHDAETVSLTSEGTTNEYIGNTTSVQDISTHLKNLMNNTPRNWELQLQAYLMQEIGRNPTLTQELFPGVEITWIGNEIYAGAGMQSIDILIYTKNDMNPFVHLIELKSVIAGASAAAQLNRYVKWLKAHIPGLLVHQVIPTLIAPGTDRHFHDHLQTYLRGHGITQYRVVNVNGDLRFNQEIYKGF